jgi:acetyl esterase/lipase
MKIWKWFPKWLRIIFTVLFSLLLVVFIVIGIAYWYFNPEITRTNGIVYGQRHGKNLLIDIFRPATPNNKGIVYIASNGWISANSGRHPAFYFAPILRRGYTVLAVYHVSQPEATVSEIIEDVHRGVRFIRHNAAQYGIDGKRLGLIGASAGGHIGLMLATRGGPGPAEAADAIDRESSSVQAVAIFYPLTDLLNLGESSENPGDGGPPKSFVEAFGPEAQDMSRWREIGYEISPIYHIKKDLPPILIYHGDADTLVPLEQSERFRDRAAEQGGLVEIVIHAGGKHGWPTMLFDMAKFADWYDKHL